jgi:hypothetical protein
MCTELLLVLLRTYTLHRDRQLNVDSILLKSSTAFTHKRVLTSRILIFSRRIFETLLCEYSIKRSSRLEFIFLCHWFPLLSRRKQEAFTKKDSEVISANLSEGLAQKTQSTNLEFSSDNLQIRYIANICADNPEISLYGLCHTRRTNIVRVHMWHIPYGCIQISAPCLSQRYLDCFHALEHTTSWVRRVVEILIRRLSHCLWLAV